MGFSNRYDSMISQVVWSGNQILLCCPLFIGIEDFEAYFPFFSSKFYEYFLILKTATSKVFLTWQEDQQRQHCVGELIFQEEEGSLSFVLHLFTALFSWKSKQAHEAFRGGLFWVPTQKIRASTMFAFSGTGHPNSRIYLEILLWIRNTTEPYCLTRYWLG